MLLSRDYVGYMAKEIVKRLVAGKMIETKNVEIYAAGSQGDGGRNRRRRPHQRGSPRNSGASYSDEMRHTGASYQEMYKKVKGQLARERKLILR